MATFGCVLIFLGVGSAIFAEVYQCILCAQKYGVIFGGENFTILIPHWSAWFFLVALVLIIIGWIILAYKSK